MAIAIEQRMPPFGRILFAILVTIALTAFSYALDGSGSGTHGDAGFILSPKLAGTVTVDTAADATTGQLKALATIIPDGVSPRWEWYAASDASGTGSRPIGNGDGAVTTGFFPGCYVKAVVRDAAGRFDGSVKSEWSGPVTMAMTGDASIYGVSVGYRPGFRVSGIPADGNGVLIAVERRYQAASAADGSQAIELAGSGAEDWSIPESLKGRWIRLVITPSAEYGNCVFGSIASDWVQVS